MGHFWVSSIISLASAHVRFVRFVGVRVGFDLSDLLIFFNIISSFLVIIVIFCIILCIFFIVMLFYMPTLNSGIAPNLMPSITISETIALVLSSPDESRIRLIPSIS